MFQSLKKWVKNEDVQQTAVAPAGMQMMKSDLQRKFAKGVQYNLKIVIRGDRNTGKTCLWHRLRGMKFSEEYIPTAEIQVASIQWDYKATDDIVKVDVWDVVDQGKSKKKLSKGLKIENDKDKDDLEDPALDAGFIDVYKHTHAVIMVFDITKKWTFSYIEKELPKVPNHIPVLILANFRDMGHHRVITLYEIETLVESIDRTPGSASIMFYESSMKNGFGLKYVHKFFNMPFLLVQRESLLKQLETNHLDLESCMEELSTEEHGYDIFIQRMSSDKKVKPQAQPQPTPEPNKSNNDSGKHIKQHPSIASPSNKEVQKNVSQQKKDSSTSSTGTPGLFSPSQMENQSPTPDPSQGVPEKRGFMSRLFSRSSAETDAQKEVPSKVNIDVARTEIKREKVTNVEEFVPDEESVDDFLNEVTEPKVKLDKVPDSSDEEEDAGNPMVAGFQEELDSDDEVTNVSHRQTKYSLSESDEDVQVVKKQITHERPPVFDTPTYESEMPNTLIKQPITSESDSDNQVHHEITQDADISSDDNMYPTKKKDVNEDKVLSLNTLAIQSQESKSTLNSNSLDTEVSYIDSQIRDTHQDEGSRYPPVAIITPLQTKVAVSPHEDEVETSVKNQGLSLTFDADDLDFLEDSSVKKSSEDKKRKKSKKSDRKSSGETSSRKHEKSHSRRGEDRKHRTKSNQDNSGNDKESKDSRRKKKSKKLEPSPSSDIGNDDLEAFLNT